MDSKWFVEQTTRGINEWESHCFHLFVKLAFIPTSTTSSSNQLCDFVSQIGTAEVLDPVAIHAFQLHFHLLLFHPSQLRSKHFIPLHKRMSESHSPAFRSLYQAFHLRFIQFAEWLLWHFRDLQAFDVCCMQSNPLHRHTVTIRLVFNVAFSLLPILNSMIQECKSSVTQRRTDSNRRFRRLGVGVVSISNKREKKTARKCVNARVAMSGKPRPVIITQGRISKNCVWEKLQKNKHKTYSIFV